MVAYSFKAHFRAPILDATKRQTVRADRKRHARPGETLQLYTGMRTRSCRLIGLAVCEVAEPITFDFDRWTVDLHSGAQLRTPEDLDAFARLDGFADWGGLLAFWAAEHPGLPRFSGILIGWGQTLRAAP